MAKPKLTVKEDSFASNVVLNGGDKLQAYKDAGYSQKMNPTTMAIQADKLYNKPKINLKIEELQRLADTKANEVFTISLEWRLSKLLEIANAGMGIYLDQSGNERRESLTASTGAIKTMNEMLGVGSDEQDAQSLNINFTVSQPVGDIKITRGE